VLKVYQVHLVHPRLELRVLKVQEVHKDLLVQLALRVIELLRVHKGRQVLKVLKDLEVQPFQT
jgi:hypothetical protein